MPKHPQFSNMPIVNLDKLYDSLLQLEAFKIIDGSFYWGIDRVMSELYPTAFEAYAMAEMHGGVISDDYEDANGTSEMNSKVIGAPSAYQLYSFVSVESEEQFIQDLMHLVGHLLGPEQQKTDGLSETMIKSRDIEYYRSNALPEKDYETIEKYSNQGRTVWFPADTFPLRKGIYEVSTSDYENPELGGYAYWSGNGWGFSYKFLSQCIKNLNNSSDTRGVIGYCWRGFLNQQK